jgi:hypothetical protein
MAADSIIPIIAARSNALRASIVRHLARRRATSAADAVSFFAGSEGERRAFDALLSKGIVVEAEPSRFYINEDVIDAIRYRRLRALRIVAFAAIVTGVVAIGAAVTR